MCNNRAKYEQLVNEYRTLRAEMMQNEEKYAKMLERAVELTDELVQLEDDLWRDGQLE